MKNLILTIALLLVSLISESQTISKVPWYQWSNPIAYEISPTPLVTGWGIMSDSLSGIYGDKDFYEYNGEYYLIDSWADYYLWFTKKYWHQFQNPMEYELYYLQENDLAMATYITSRFIGHMYPSFITVQFYDKEPTINKMANSKYYPLTEKERKSLLRRLRQKPVAKNDEPNQKGAKSNFSNETKVDHVKKPVIRNAVRVRSSLAIAVSSTPKLE